MRERFNARSFYKEKAVGMQCCMLQNDEVTTELGEIKTLWDISFVLVHPKAVADPGGQYWQLPSQLSRGGGAERFPEFERNPQTI